MHKFKGISKNSPLAIFSKFFRIAIFAFLCASYTSADTASFEGRACTVGVEYNSKAEPGDAIVVRMTLRGKERKRAVKDTVAQAELRTETKKIDSAQFFYINQKAKKQNVQELLAYVPVSMWVSDGAYTIKVIYSAFGAELGLGDRVFDGALSLFSPKRHPNDDCVSRFGFGIVLDADRARASIERSRIR